MRILLFGGAGFIGEYLARVLHARSDCDIIVVDRDSQTTAQDFDADIVVVLTQPNGPVKNVLLPAITLAKNIKKIVYLSTLLLYPDAPHTQDETVAPDPKTEYEIGKHNEELLLSDFTAERDFVLCIPRLANIYGDIQNRGIVHYMLLSAIKGDEFIVFGDKDKKVRDYIFIEDVVRFLEFLVFYPQSNKKEIFNICTGVGYSIAELISTLEAISGKQVNVNVGRSVLEKKSIIGENKKILNLSGYEPEHDLTRGLQKTYRNYTAFYLSKS
ncbi:MAG TPA: NAD(P)-dependent oxidoreductase [Candidatus Paceibacterota bacterium]